MWRTVFSVLLVFSLYVLFVPASQVPTGVEVSDKLIHGALFGALALSGGLAGPARWPLLVALVAYAGLSEVLQAVLPINRDGDVLDAVADTVGTVVGLVAVSALRRRSTSSGASRR